MALRIPSAIGMDMVGLCVFAAGGGRAGDEIRPFGTDIDEAVTEFHFGVAEVPTTRLYDRRRDELTLDEVERVVI
jgi:hypothetical protein